ncbi:MAG: ABC transporter permease [Gulosibacter sp.]|uniref:ABC transporter permease n=1 Tax=Gulosibacter sp. TaxID=2817531 RepID=UPI003F909426
MFEIDFGIPWGQWVETATRWIVDVFGIVFDVIGVILDAPYDFFYMILSFVPNWVVMAIVVVLAILAKGTRGIVLAIGSVIGMLFIVSVGQWDNAMRTLSLVLVASILALVIAIPTGIWAAKSERASRVIRPILDFFQTMPAMVYLIPALLLFGVGVVPGIFATVIFSLPPGVRMTELGIRGVDKEVVEAGRAFGATPNRILRQIELPLALPSIMAGVNQVIMLSLSMVVIAGMVGAAGLGQQVTQALQSIDLALGFEAGLSVVVIAMILDRLTGGIGKKRKRAADSTKSAEQKAEQDNQEQTAAPVTA